MMRAWSLLCPKPDAKAYAQNMHSIIVHLLKVNFLNYRLLAFAGKNLEKTCRRMRYVAMRNASGVSARRARKTTVYIKR